LEATTLRLRHQGSPPDPKKGAIVRRLKQRPGNAVVLFEDETLLRWFPPLRHTWAFRGEQAVVPITGQNAKRVLFGAVNPRTGHRLLLRRYRQRQEDFQEFLRYLRRHYPGRPIWLLLDKAPCHEAVRSQALAARLGIVLVWLPKQCSELNAMDHLWKELKRVIAANRQFPTIDDEAENAERWVLQLTPQQARRKCGVLSGNFWLNSVV
jgi:transposase